MVSDGLDAQVSAAFSLRELCEDRLRVDLVPLGSRPPVEYSLIEQVQQAVAGFSFEGGGASSGRTGVPFDIELSEMYSALCFDLRRAAVRYELVEPGAAEDPLGDARLLLGHLDLIPESELLEYSSAWASWCEAIRSYLNPGRRTPLAGKACPEPDCRASVWFSYDGEDRVQSPALWAVWVGERIDRVECRCCFSVWPRERLAELAETLNPGVLLQFSADGG